MESSRDEDETIAEVVLSDTGDALLANEAVRSAYLGG